MVGDEIMSSDAFNIFGRDPLNELRQIHVKLPIGYGFGLGNRADHAEWTIAQIDQLRGNHIPRLLQFLAGDIFGLENGSVHRFTAEAIVDTTVRLVKRRSLEHVAQADVHVALDLLNMTTTSLQHAEEHMLLLGRKTSLERVAAFLLEMDRRLSGAGIMALPMSRRDIADYLGLTLETVSRALSYLHDKGILGFRGQTQRQIVLLDRVHLSALEL